MARTTKSLSELLDPNHGLSGREMRRVSRALTRIEIRPLLKAYARQAKRYQRDQRRDLRGLERLRKTTTKQIRGSNQRVDQAMRQHQNEARTQGAQLQATIDQTARESAARMESLQTGVLGDQIKALAAQGIAPGQSASQADLSAQASNQQARQVGMDGQWQNFAGTAAMQGNLLASMSRASSRRAGLGALNEANRAMMDRKADTRNAYGEARREVLGKMADQKALWGPTMLKNLMTLRDSERKFSNEKMALALDRARFGEDVRSNRAEEAIDRQKAQDGDSGGSGGSGGSDDSTYRDFFQAAQAIRTDGGKTPGNSIVPNRDFWQEVAQSEGLSLNPRQANAWARRYRRWLKQNGLIG